MNYIGIDPGASGGLAVINDYGRDIFAFLCVSKATERDISDWLVTHRDNATCALENPLGSLLTPIRFGRNVSPKAISELSMRYGFLRGVLVAQGIRFVEVRPKAWQTVLSIPPIKDEGGTQKKNRHKGRAQQLFPGVIVTHAIADALLLAEYARMTSDHLTRKEVEQLGGEHA